MHAVWMAVTQARALGFGHTWASKKRGKRDKNYTVEEKSFIGSLCIPKSGRISCCEGKESEGWIRPAQQSAYLLVRGRKRRRQEALISPGEKSIPKLFFPDRTLISLQL